jgi:O-succinylbenzoic acid--CoA ligase
MDAWLLLAARMHPGRAALVTARGSLTYAELAERALGAAGQLVERGVSAGGRVGLALPAGLDFVVALHGCLLARAAAVPIDLRLRDDERAARAAGAAVLVDAPLGGARKPVELSELSEPEPGDVATVVYTSGTTAEPRAVSLTYGNWHWNALGSALALGLGVDERWLCPMPLAHVGGLSILLRSAIYGTTAVLHERFDTSAVLDALMDPDQRITVVSLVPTMFARLLDAGLREPRSLRWALLGGGPIPPALLRRAAEAGVPVAPTYGMTEACSQIATFGWPLTGVSVKIEDGEVLVQGPSVSEGALGDDGWLHTGDLGTLDGHGELRIVGRKADTIVTGGENVSPAEVEAALLEHPAVADAAVHARPDPEWGEAVVATVVLRDGLDAGPDELRAWSAERVAAFKVPKTIAFAERLPRTAAGKLLRRELE